MQLRVEQLQGLERKLQFEIPADEIKEKVNARLKSFARNAALPGFRPGKVPFDIVRARFQAAVHQEVIEELINETYVDAVKEQNLKPAGYPKMDLAEVDLEKPLEFSATVEVYPEIAITRLTGEKIERLLVEVSDSDINERIEQIRENNAEWVEVDRAAQMGDTLILDFEGKQNGKPLERGNANDFDVRLGSGSLIPGFEEGLVGVKAGDEKILHLTFPDNYVASDVAGQPVDFEVKVKAVKEAKLPEMTEAFIKTIGIEDGSMETLREKIRTQLVQNINEALKEQLKDVVFEKWLGKQNFLVPQVLITEQAKHLRDQFVQQLKDYTQSKENISLPHEPYEKNARKQVAMGLLVQEFIQQQKLVVDQARVQQLLEKMAENFPDKQEFMQYYRRHNQLMRQLENRVLEEQVFETLLTDVELSNKTLTHKEAIEFLKAREKEKQQKPAETASDAQN